MKTKVLLSSIFFIADSVVRGYLMMENLSKTFRLGALFRENLGLRGRILVWGRRKVAVVRIFRVLFWNEPFFTLLCTFKAFALADAAVFAGLAAGFAAATFFTFFSAGLAGALAAGLGAGAAFAGAFEVAAEAGPEEGAADFFGLGGMMLIKQTQERKRKI